MHEFNLIKHYAAPLAAGEPGAFGLTDDAAVLAPSPGCELVVTADAMAENVHYFSWTHPRDVAKRLLRSNLSDMAAMGAVPRWYLLTACYGPAIDEAWVAAFTEGLAADQVHLGVTLVGGDTVRQPHHSTLSLTLLGEVPAGQALRRSGAQVGDDVYVSGTIGDAALGLKILQKQTLDIPQAVADIAVQRYHAPQPRLALGQALRGIASAAMDVSDGLVADAEKLCGASSCGATINLSSVPVQEALRRHMQNYNEISGLVISGGDDYELLFTAEKSKARQISNLTHKLGINITRIGTVTAGNQLKVLGADGQAIDIAHKGYVHS